MPKVQLNMRIEQHLKQRLDAAAEDQHRTVTNLVEWLIKQYLDQHHPQPEEKKQESSE